ncbi:YrhB domain-containing protein [Flavobacterium sp. SUN052]|uniref:YrhB domain-containing protein n=1 Tax=Flavobacterium sp. SUN052 TaxID=3002441 RepID=UPI00237D5B4D|nr:YrhB domain-containing protein [Flavobacterium sp. SUN052]MEC4004910.1 YrhB domain-containing protein [Flavobacterium sp. SUN052]
MQKQIIKIAEKHIKELEIQAKVELIIGYEETIIKPYGSIFFYTSKKFAKTEDFKYAIAGNAPFLVENESGKIISFGTSESDEYYIEEYEAGRWPVK